MTTNITIYADTETTTVVINNKVAMFLDFYADMQAQAKSIVELLETLGHSVNYVSGGIPNEI